MRKCVTKKSRWKMMAHIFSDEANTLKAHMPQERTRQAPSCADEVLSLILLISREPALNRLKTAVRDGLGCELDARL